MREPGLAPANEKTEDPTIVIFLGLYLLLLAFFMLLNSISNIDSERAVDAAESVGQAFSALKPPEVLGRDEMIAKGAVLETNTFQGQAKAAFATISRIAQVEFNEEGDKMRVETDVDSLFTADGESFKEKTSVFLDRIAKVINRGDEGMRREVEVIIGVGDELPQSVDAGSSQRLRQVTRFASAFIEREVSSAVISIGLSPGEDGNIVMFLNARTVEDEAAGARQNGVTP